MLINSRIKNNIVSVSRRQTHRTAAGARHVCKNTYLHIMFSIPMIYLLLETLDTNSRRSVPYWKTKLFDIFFHKHDIYGDDCIELFSVRGQISVSPRLPTHPRVVKGIFFQTCSRNIVILNQFAPYKYDSTHTSPSREPVYLLVKT